MDPNKITYFQRRGPKRFGKVVRGDWDHKGRIRFAEHTNYQSIHAHFVKGKAWESTNLYQKCREKVLKGEAKRWNTEGDLYNYFEGIDRLYSQIKKHGYKSQESLFEKDPEQAFRKSNDAPHPYLNEIGINIARDGTMMKRGGGHHRLSIAKILDIDRVPVTVRCRHSEWQAMRDEIRKAKSINELSARAQMHLDHPDMQGIVSDVVRREAQQVNRSYLGSG